MQTFNLVHVDKSDIKYHIDTFPDGEKSLVIDSELNHKVNFIDLYARLSSMDEIFVMLQAADILNRHGVLFNLNISYLMSMRMDRVMDWNRPFSLKVVANMIKNCGAKEIYVLEPHSERTLLELGNAKILGSELNRLKLFGLLDKTNSLSHTVTVFPDAGAKNRYYSWYSNTIVCFKKKRNLSTGQIVGLTPDTEKDTKNIQYYTDFMIVDDLCDGGGTFIGIANKIREINPSAKLSIVITHLVNKRGLENLSKHFDIVYVTNSYKDWNKEDNFPDNVKIVEVI